VEFYLGNNTICTVTLGVWRATLVGFGGREPARYRDRSCTDGNTCYNRGLRGIPTGTIRRGG